MSNTIQHRRGLEADFRPDKILPGELTVSTDSENVYMGIRPGRVKKLAGQSDVDSVANDLAALQENLNASTTEIIANTSAITQTQKDMLGTVNRVEMSEDRKYCYFYHDDEMLYEVGPFAGEGGGGGGGGGDTTTTTVMTIGNTSGWLAKSIAPNTDCPIGVTWSSTLDEIETGDGVARVIINGSTKMTLNVSQGEFTVNPAKYMGKGQNRVRIQVTDSYENSKYINFTVTVVDMSLTSRFSTATPFSGDIPFPYTPYGEIEKTVHFVLDGVELGTETTALNGRQLSKTIPAQSHGAHKLECYFVAEIDGVDVESNHLKYEFMSIAPGNNTPIITSSYDESEAEQYSNIAIKYRVYSPASMTTDVVLAVDGARVNVLTVDRSEQTWSYRAMSEGELTLTITSGYTVKTFTVNVKKSSATIEAVTSDLELYLTAQGRNNAEEHPEVWQYESISAVMSDFNFVLDGWQLDSSNTPVLRLFGDARVTVPCKIFARDFRSTGKTIEFEFSTSDVMNYDTPIISCFSGGRGIVITSQSIKFASEQSSIVTQFKEDEHIRVSFSIEKRTENRLIYCYVNGDLAYVMPYPDDDDFSQISPVDITIGTNDATVDIYCIRVYNNNLNMHQILGNMIADTADVNKMLAMYERNNIFDESGNIVIEKLQKDLPYMIIACDQLPQYKGDKKTCTITYVDPAHPEKSFTAENVQIDVQGTSSQYYPRKNYKLKCKNGFTNSKGENSGKYQLKDDVLPANVFCMKADFASSDQCNNVEICEISEMINPYKTPAQQEDSLVRQTVAGLPCVIFWDGGNGASFIGRL